MLDQLLTLAQIYYGKYVSLPLKQSLQSTPVHPDDMNIYEILSSLDDFN